MDLGDLKNWTDDEVLHWAKTANEDCIKAADEERNSEWHDTCFAACVVMSQEMGRRGIKLPGAPAVH